MIKYLDNKKPNTLLSHYKMNRSNLKLFNLYLRVLAVCYFVGFVLHFLDILNLRLSLSEMNLYWKIWIWYLLIFDFLASLLLWSKSKIGEVIFFIVASSQLIAYIFFTNIFGQQTFLIWFHVIVS